MQCRPHRPNHPCHFTQASLRTEVAAAVAKARKAEADQAAAVAKAVDSAKSGYEGDLRAYQQNNAKVGGWARSMLASSGRGSARPRCRWRCTSGPKSRCGSGLCFAHECALPVPFRRLRPLRTSTSAPRRRTPPSTRWERAGMGQLGGGAALAPQPHPPGHMDCRLVFPAPLPFALSSRLTSRRSPRSVTASSPRRRRPTRRAPPLTARSR